MTRAKDISKIVTDADLSGTLDVTGTITSSDITISDNNPTLIFDDANGVDQNFTFAVNGGTANIQSRTDAGVNTTRFTVSSNGNIDFKGGDISFYEDTGTTPKLFWDASAERLGLGTTSPSRVLHISHPTVGGMKLQATTDNYDAFVEFQTVDNNAFIGLDDSLNLLKINNDAGIGAYNHLVIDTSGNVGIGTSSPDSKLHIFNSDASITASVDADDLIVENNGACGITIGSATNSTGSIRFADSGGTHLGMLYYSHITNEMRLYTSSTQRMSIDSSGAVEIGTYGGTGATRGFIVDPSVNSNGYRIRSSVTTSSNLAHYQFANTNGIVGAIRTNGTATAYDTSSDYRLKENVTADWDATTRLKQLNPVRFNFIADADTTVDGFLAHEVQSVVPEAISGTHNEVEVWQDGEELPDGVSVGDNKLDEDGNTIPVYQGIDQSKLVPLLVKTIQELEARITALETA